VVGGTSQQVNGQKQDKRKDEKKGKEGKPQGEKPEPPCPTPPTAPPGVNVDNNIDIAKDYSWLNPGALVAFGNLVRNHGDWDYKQASNARPSPYEAFGNFNYGATGAAMGMPDQVLLRMAGVASIVAGTSPKDSSNPLWRAPYGDSPVDQSWIEKGIEYSKCVAGAAL
ncbi:MAG: polymorphic toxin type 44 domain-containing protein, partial [Gammaproteobacteria bacterium]